MASNFALEFSYKGIDESIDRAAKEYPQSCAKALKTTAGQVRTQIKKAITSRYNIPSSSIRDDILINVDSTNLIATLKMKGSKFKMSLFNPKWSNRGGKRTPKGMSIEIVRGKRTAVNYFVTQTKSGHVGIFERSGAGMRWSKSRPMPKKVGFKSQPGLPIREITTLSASQMFTQNTVADKLKQVFYDKFPKILNQRLKFDLGLIKIK